MNRRHLYVTASILALAGLGLFLYKAVGLGLPLLPGTTLDRWDVEIRIGFYADKPPIKVVLSIPSSDERFTIQQENFIAKGYGLTTRKRGDSRLAVWSIRHASGEQVLYYRAVVQRQEGAVPLPQVSRVPEPTVSLEGPYLAAAEALLARAQTRSADLETLVSQILQLLSQTDSNATLLLDGQDTVAKKIDAAVRLLALAGVPAREVWGVRLDERRRSASLAGWLEVYDKHQGSWQAYHPENATLGLPDDFLVISRDSRSLVQLIGGHRATTEIAVRRTAYTATAAARKQSRSATSRLMEFSLFSLPVRTQEVYRVLLLVPVGAFLVVILRTLIGIRTFGTFMPVLIALAFRETRLVWGVVLFSLVVACGLAVRSYLEQLKLLLVPRLASVLIVVVAVMAVLSILSNKLGLERGLSVALFPMVILVMTIERMSVVWEELGAAEALTQGVGSMAVAVLAHLVMINATVEHLVFVFPELLLLLLAVILLLGRYSGYRLTELWRFRVLGRVSG